MMPTGTVTLLFTDIEGSTRLWQEHPELMPVALARHDALLREAIATSHGFVVKTVGDAFMAVFPTAHDGVQAALKAQRSLCTEPWPSPLSLRIRMGLHTGTPQQRDNDYYGHEVNRAARIQAVGHSQQILLSQSVFEDVKESLPADASLLDLGLHRLKDLHDPEPLWQLCHPDLPAAFPPLNSLSYWPNNLPHQTSRFIGRETQIAEGQRLLARGACLTLVGAGGCGKTRLALQIAAEVLPDFPHGVWVVELAAITEASLVASAVASVLGLHEEPSKTITQTVIEYARSRTLLLVLDNCEHLLVACAQLVDALLKSCPQVKLLVTSREPLNLKAEQTYRVPSLSLPDPKHVTLDTLRQCEASQLFIERAFAVKTDFVLTERNAPAIAQICQHLDGIPLAIELAAARVKALTVEEINTRLDHRFRLLTGGDRLALPRQQTLRALIDWSYDLLTEAEKTLLRRLSVFKGGWTLASSEAVCAGEGTSGEGIEEWEVLDLLSSLVDKSLVVAHTEEQTTRYPLLETVRQYALDRLVESGESQLVRGRHRDHFLSLAEEIQLKLHGPEQAKWLGVLEEEHDNLRQALTFCLEEPDGGEKGLRLGTALHKFWWVRGYWTEGRERWRLLLAHPSGQERNKLRADALNGAGILAWIQSDYALARSLLQDSLAIWREFGHKRGIASSLGNLGILAEQQGDYVTARSLLEETLEIDRELGNKADIASTLISLGIVAAEQADYDLARPLFEESLAYYRELEDKQSMAISLGNLANVARARGEYASARSLNEQSLAIHRELGNRQGISSTLGNLGIIAEQQGDCASARSLLRDSLIIRKEIGDQRGIAAALDSFASLAIREQEPERSARLWGAASALREVLGSPLSPKERAKQQQEAASARQILGDAVFAAAWEEGRLMTSEQAAAYALE
jgi:predicted ATPase/class 3 adenylate cyclase